MYSKFIFVKFSIAVTAFLIAGCASPPQWAMEGDSFRDPTENALWGVGEARPALGDREVLLAAARTRAWTNLKAAELEYSTKLLNTFFKDNEDWFNTGELEEFFSVFKTNFFSHNYLTGNIEDEWVDTGGRIDGEGTVYALAHQKLDDGFFHALRQAALETMEKQSEALLNEDIDKVASALEDFLLGVAQNPLKALHSPEL